jgi:Mce-associated membrane protein
MGVVVYRWNDDAVSEQQARKSETPTWFVALVATAALVLVASAGVLVWLAPHDSADASTVVSDDGSEELRGELVGIAEQYFVEANTYDFTNVEDYKRRVHPLMTDQNRTTFDKTLGQIGPSFAKVEAHATGTVRQSAVETLDSDSATVMVTGDAKFESTTIKRAYFPRWEVMLRFVDGEWLVDSHTELGDSGVFSATGGTGG